MVSGLNRHQRPGEQTVGADMSHGTEVPRRGIGDGPAHVTVPVVAISADVGALTTLRLPPVAAGMTHEDSAYGNTGVVVGTAHPCTTSV
jgi:hypothetical protein